MLLRVTACSRMSGAIGRSPPAFGVGVSGELRRLRERECAGSEHHRKELVHAARQDRAALLGIRGDGKQKRAHPNTPSCAIIGSATWAGLHPGPPSRACRRLISSSEIYINACCKSPIRSSVFSSPMEMRNKFCGVCVFGPSIDARCSIRLCVPPRLVARVKSWTARANLHSSFARATQPYGQHSPEPDHLTCRNVIARMVDQPWVIDCLYRPV